jgi:hypothetical protein
MKRLATTSIFVYFKLKSHVVISFFFFKLNSGPHLAMQVLYHLSHSENPLLGFIKALLPIKFVSIILPTSGPYHLW